jgi:hypothetical protein
MINNELVLTDTNSEFVRVRFEFVAIYISIPAPIPSSAQLPPLLAFTLTGCPSRSAQPALVVWGLAGAFRLKRRFEVCEIGCYAGKCRSHQKYNFNVI